jgi:hypothetical protein
VTAAARAGADTRRAGEASRGDDHPGPDPVGVGSAQPVITTAPPTRLAVLRIGVLGGVVGMLCCVGPTLLALAGIVGATTAAAWATTLYDGYAWWFRGAGLVTIAALVLVSLLRQRRCSLSGLRSARRVLLTLTVIAVMTYAALDCVTTALGHLAGRR